MFRNRIPPSPLPKPDHLQKPILNVLLLGQTQSGKSTFIETVKKYAEPDYEVDYEKIGDSANSFTKQVSESTIVTDLPITGVLRMTETDPVAIKVESLLQDNSDFDEFEDTINERKNLQIVRAKSSNSPTQYRFNLFDTPGLNDTHGEDEAHIASIFEALKAAGSIHLVLITVGQGPFTKGFQEALKCYFDMFPEFQGLVAFVHTSFDYRDLHSSRKRAHSHLGTKKETLHEILGRDSCKHFEIDCDLETNKPLRISITHNTIRDILCMAPFNQPVAMNRIMMRKTTKMKIVDNILIEKYKTIVDTRQKALEFKNEAQAIIMAKLVKLETEINNLRSEVSDHEEYIDEHKTGDLVMIHESEFNEEWKLLHRNKKYHMELPEQEHIIQKVNIFHDKAEIRAETGGKGYSYWRISFKRRRFKDGKLHAKLYTTRALFFRIPISSRQSRLFYLRGILPGVEDEHARYSRDHKSEEAQIKDLVELNKLHTRLISRLSSEKLRPDLFQKMVKEKAYIGDTSANAKVVEKIYLEMIQNDKREILERAVEAWSKTLKEINQREMR